MLITKEAMHVKDKEGYEKSMYLPPNFSVKLIFLFRAIKS